MSEKQVHSFEAETKEILNLMVHSIYTHKEIFLRELISNASDALDKARFESITKSDKYKNINDLKITISTNEETRVITISDNGIGMTKDEVISNIGSIARSGTKLFLDKLKDKNESKDSGIDLIGQFGVGFYSAFMISDDIILETRSVDSDKGVRWQSTGDGTYTIEEIERDIDKRGTDIILKLKDFDADDRDSNYADRYNIKRLIQKYSDYVNYPIMMDMPKLKEKPEDKEEFESQIMNSMVSIWQKNKNDITRVEYDDFYKAHFHDYQDPFEVIHTKVEGTIEYTALLFLPKKSQFNFLAPDNERGLDLYCRNVFIMSKCKELLPEYLRFVKGLVDSPDFSLNISREVLQHTGQLKKIASNIEKKVLELLEKKLKNERESYEQFWSEFGESLKVGIYSDFNKKDTLSKLLLFKSSEHKDDHTSLTEYVSRMKEGQEFIYYAAGSDSASIEKLPHLENLRTKGYEVLYFMDRVDEFMVQTMREFDGKTLRSVSQGSFENSDSKEEKIIDAKTNDILNAIKEVLGETKVVEVTESERLTESAVCLVSREGSMTFNMAKVLAESGQDMFGMGAERILEINIKHPIFEKIKNEFDSNKSSDLFKEYSELLYDEACILEGIKLDDPMLFAKRMNSLLMK